MAAESANDCGPASHGLDDRHLRLPPVVTPNLRIADTQISRTADIHIHAALNIVGDAGYTVGGHELITLDNLYSVRPSGTDAIPNRGMGEGARETDARSARSDPGSKPPGSTAARCSDRCAAATPSPTSASQISPSR